MARAYIGLGSNLGDGRDNLREAWRRLGERAGVALLALSSPYLSKPVAKAAWLAAGKVVAEGMFTNGVGMLESGLSPRELLKVMQEIELDMGRDRGQTVNRIIDLDLLYYDDLVLTGEDLCLPHPELQRRRFVLAPLAELAPDQRHPLLNLTSRQMLDGLAVSEDDAVQRLDWPVANLS